MVNLIILFRKVTLACALSGAISFCSAASFTNFSAARRLSSPRGPTGNLANNNYGGGRALGLAAPGLPNGGISNGAPLQPQRRFECFQTPSTRGWRMANRSLYCFVSSSSPHNNVIF